jgi:hypothetical protein
VAEQHEPCAVRRGSGIQGFIASGSSGSFWPRASPNRHRHNINGREPKPTQNFGGASSNRNRLGLQPVFNNHSTNVHARTGTLKPGSSGERE